jgi:hypothetical protein
LIERMSMKKAKATQRVALRSFGLDQFVGKSFELARTTIPIVEIEYWKSAKRSEADNPLICKNQQ